MHRLAAPLMVAAVVVLLLDLFVLLLGPLVAPYDPNQLDIAAALTKRSASHRLGADDLGRDILSRKLYGAVSPDNRTIVIATRDTSRGKAIIALEVLAVAGIIGGLVIRRRHARWDPILAIVAGVILLATVAHLIAIARWLPGH